MSYGVSIQNSAGQVVISELYQNYHLVARGSYANASGPPALAAGEILLVRPSTLGATLSFADWYGWAISTTGVVNYAIVKNNNTPSTDSYGLRVWTAANQLAFDSGRRSMVPVSQGRVGPWGVVGVTQPFAPVPGRIRYVSASSFVVTGIYESGAGHYDIWRITSMTWNSEVSMTLMESPEGGMAPGGTDFPVWGTSTIFVFADV